MLMRPRLSSAAHAGLGLINDERNAVLLCQSPQPFKETRCSKQVIEGRDGFNNDCTGLSPLALRMDDSLDLQQALVFLHVVEVLVLCERELQLRVWRLWPWERWQAFWVGSARAHRQSACGAAVMTVFKPDDEQVGYLLVVPLCKVMQCYSHGKFVCFVCRAAT